MSPIQPINSAHTALEITLPITARIDRPEAPLEDCGATGTAGSGEYWGCEGVGLTGSGSGSRSGVNSRACDGAGLFAGFGRSGCGGDGNGSGSDSKSKEDDGGVALATAVATASRFGAADRCETGGGSKSGSEAAAFGALNFAPQPGQTGAWPFTTGNRAPHFVQFACAMMHLGGHCESRRGETQEIAASPMKSG